MSMGIIFVIASIFALAVAILAFIFIVPEKRRAKLNKFGQFLHDLCNFKFLIIEKILQFCYVLATSFSIIAGFFMLFWVESYHSYYYSRTEWFGYYGLLTMILGPIAIRIGYELLMMAILAVKNIIQINNKLKNQNDDAADANPFSTPNVADYYTPQQAAPTAENVSYCPYCGAQKEPDAFCPNCGQK